VGQLIQANGITLFQPNWLSCPYPDTGEGLGYEKMMALEARDGEFKRQVKRIEEW
jgi:hypothetical protein